MTDAALERAKEILTLYPGKWRSGVACFTFVNKKDAKEPTQAYSGGAACHGGLTSRVVGYYVINAHKPGLHGKYPDFVKWVCREAPFSHGVVNKDNDKEILSQGIIIDGDLVGSAGALWLVKALRHTVEDTFRIPVWEKLRTAGLDDLQAFIGCSILDTTGEPQRNRTHCGLFQYSTPGNLYAWYQELLKEKVRTGSDASRPPGWPSPFWGKVWGTLGYKTVKKSDGWGGFTEIKEPSDPTEFVEKLKMIFAGDYKNVG